MNALQSVTSTLPATGPRVDPEALTTIAGACRDRERLRFDYSARDATQSRRLVEPHSLVNLGRRWYLVAWDCDREDWRTFRVDRIERPSSAGARFTARTLPGDGEAAAYVAANLRQSPSRFTARITIHAPPAALAERWPWMRDSLTPLGSDRSEYRTSDDSLEWLAMRVGMVGVDFEVHEPPELVDAMRALSERLRRAAPTS